MRTLLILIIGMCCFPAFGQTDSIALKVIYAGNSSLIQVEQEFDVIPNSDKDEYFLHAWANAYKDKATTLAQTKLTSRDDALYFAPIDERGWIENIHFYDQNNQRLPFSVVENELYKVIIGRTHGRIKFKAVYEIHLPNKRFTDYGIDSDGNLLLKYFFLQPAMQENGEIVIQNFKDFESLSANNSYYELEIHVPTYYSVYTDLRQISANKYVGDEMDFFQIAVKFYSSTHTIDTSHGKVIFGFQLPVKDFIYLSPIINEELDFLSHHLGPLEEPLFISRKNYRKNKLEGIQDVHIPVINKTYKIFDKETRLRLEMLTQLTFAYADRKILVDMRKDHWIRNGIKAYLAARYVEENYPELLLAGNIPDDISLFQIYPLKIFEASKVKMSQRTELFYRMFLTSNLDQSLDTPYDELSNLNQKNVSYFKAALGFQYLATYLGEEEFDVLLRNMILENDGLQIDQTTFRSYFQSHASKDVTWFFDEFVHHKENIDVGIRTVKVEEDSVYVKIKNRSEFKAPIRLSAYKNGQKVYDDWIENPTIKMDVALPVDAYDLIVVNDSIHFPDFNLKNNYYSPESFFRKKLKLGLITDVPSSRHEQIFFTPELEWNNYDKFQLGMLATNKTVLPQPWIYKIKPQYSTGENALTGSVGMSYTISPDKGWFRKITFGVGGSYQHYNRGLAYKSYSFGNSYTLSKNPRSLSRRTLHFNYQQVNRDIAEGSTPEEIELKDYKLLNLGFEYWDPKVIHERQALVKLQVSSKFSKAFGELYWRWKFSQNKRLGVRVFAGMFINYKLTSSDYFDFGLDRITDYTFSYPLLGRSETTGLLSQQFVLAEGGFKSNFFVRANQYMFAINLEYPLWKMLDLYYDMGVYKNKYQPNKFVYDSGVRVRVIPDFLELYLPVQSSLGFEPSLGAYHERIRFMLNLDLNKFIDYWRRGKY